MQSADEDDLHDEEWQPISSTEILNHVNNKASFYDACIRNDIFVPPYKDSIVTFEFLEKVLDETIWLPKAS